MHILVGILNLDKLIIIFLFSVVLSITACDVGSLDVERFSNVYYDKEERLGERIRFVGIFRELKNDNFKYGVFNSNLPALAEKKEIFLYVLFEGKSPNLNCFGELVDISGILNFNRDIFYLLTDKMTSQGINCLD